MVNFGGLCGTLKLLVFTKVVHGLTSSRRFCTHSLQRIKKWIMINLSKISNYLPQNRRGKIQIYRQIHLEIKVCLLSIIFFNVYYSLAHDQIIEFLWLFRTLAVGLFSQLLKPKKIRQNWWRLIYKSANSKKSLLSNKNFR